MAEKFKLTPYIPSEKEIRNQVVDYMRYKGWFVFRVFQGPLSYPGISDLIAIKDGRVLFIELKRPKNYQSKVQKRFQADIEYKGGEYWVVRSADDLIKRGI